MYLIYDAPIFSPCMSHVNATVTEDIQAYYCSPPEAHGGHEVRERAHNERSTVVCPMQTSVKTKATPTPYYSCARMQSHKCRCD